MVRDVLLDLKAEGRTVVFNTHRLEEAERVCDRVGILRTRLLRVGTPHELRTAMTRSRRIIIDLETVRDSDLDVLRDNGAAAVLVAGNQIELELSSPSVTSADLVAALVAGGARVNGVSAAEESLEDAYLTILGVFGVMLTDVLTITGKDIWVTMRRRSIVTALALFPSWLAWVYRWCWCSPDARPAGCLLPTS